MAFSSLARSSGEFFDHSQSTVAQRGFLIDSHTMPDFVRSRMYACLGATCHLHFWQNDRGLLRATAVTRGWIGHRIRVSTQRLLRSRKFSRRSCRDSTSRPFDHWSGAPTNKLSRLFWKRQRIKKCLLLLLLHLRCQLRHTTYLETRK